MTLIKLAATMLVIVLLAAAEAAEMDPLSENDNSAIEDIKKTMGDDILKAPQDSLGNATPVITGKNQGAATVGGQAASQPRLVSPVSNWELTLSDSQDRSVSIEMRQSNDVIFGRGTVAAGGSSQPASATGTIAGNRVNMDVLTDDLTLFRLSLTMSGRSLSGDYHGYSPTVVSWKGIAMGRIS